MQLHLETPQIPIDFISIDLISPFESATKGNQYVLTVICITNYVTCIPIPDKSADIVANIYLKEVYCRFGGILNFIIFRSNYLVRNQTLIFITCKLHINGHLEASHKLLKTV